MRAKTKNNKSLVRVYMLGSREREKEREREGEIENEMRELH